MSFKKENHLDKDQQIWAIVYEDKLPDPMREHLSLCPKCRTAIEKIKDDLKNLSQTAKRHSPVTHRKPDYQKNHCECCNSPERIPPVMQPSVNS